eukprot:681103-Pleurochrysis_carterae.AAC.1
MARSMQRIASLRCSSSGYALWSGFLAYPRDVGGRRCSLHASPSARRNCPHKSFAYPHGRCTV